MINPPLWKASVALTKLEAADTAAALELEGSAQAVLIVEEPFADGAVVEALYTEEPDAAWLSQIARREITVAPLPDQDWIRLSQEGLPPVRAGRFFVYGAHDAGVVPHGVIPMKIEAGLAFGTGHHETTALCLGVLSDLANRRKFSNVLDLGCGTGLLAIGAAKLWRKPVIASDIDIVAVEVTRENARANGVAPLIRAVTADGMTHPTLGRAAPYDMIIANILAGPLTQLAPAITRALAPGAMLVLSGLLHNQENMILSFYNGLRFVARHRDGPWSALVLEARPDKRKVQ
jgi:ribosomal protein L11 methyltransferase